MRKQYLLLGLVAALLATNAVPVTLSAQGKLEAVLKAEQERIKVIEMVKPSVVAIFARGGRGGGSGVLIDKEGYALTNYHVVASARDGTMQCGLADGVLYEAALVSRDKVGDVALIKLLPEKKGKPFPFSKMGDSDKVREGDWSLAMGNPFLLATDFNPTVTFGMVSGVHRYQYPSGTILEYTDCIQIDTSINPGNSGGPLFNMKGELIGINGRGSFDKRGRVNSGVGYAISINQIKNFMGHLRAGLDIDHASLGAVVTTLEDSSGLGSVVFSDMLEEADVTRRGLEYGDELVSFDGRDIRTVNQFKNVMGLYPRGWRIPLTYRREGAEKQIIARTMGVQARVIGGGNAPKRRPKGPKINPKIPNIPNRSPALKYVIRKPGFVNYYFNKQERDRVLKNFRAVGDFTKYKGKDFTVVGDIRLKYSNNASPWDLTVREENDGKKTEPVVRMKINVFPYQLRPIASDLTNAEYKVPVGSGGYLAAMFLYNRLLTMGTDGFITCKHAGYERIYPPLPNGRNPDNWKKTETIAEVIQATYGPYTVKWYFEKHSDETEPQKLVAMEMRTKEEEDPCEVYFTDYRPVNGQLIPHAHHVRYVNTDGDLVPYGNIRGKSFQWK